MGKREEYLELLGTIDPDGDFAGLIPMENRSFDGHIHSVMEKSTGELHMSQGETYSPEGFIVAIDRKGRYEELKPSKYEIVEVLQWDAESDDLLVVPYTEEE